MRASGLTLLDSQLRVRRERSEDAVCRPEFCPSSPDLRVLPQFFQQTRAVHARLFEALYGVYQERRCNHGVDRVGD